MRNGGIKERFSSTTELYLTGEKFLEFYHTVQQLQIMKYTADFTIPEKRLMIHYEEVTI